jgi:diguanylate cyclase (GGDEF)-like protein/PAS domain S-box-containing protein/putative nucleotidyltransferase with HDIG domain
MMNSRKTRILLILLMFFLTPLSLWSVSLPTLDEAIKHMSSPVLLIEAQTKSIVHANPITSTFFSIPHDRLNGRSLLSLLGLKNQSIVDLHGKILSIPQADGPNRKLQAFVQSLVSDGTYYYLVMLQDRTAQEHQLTRSRILSISLFTLLIVSVLFIALFLVLQIKLMHKLEEQQKKQVYSIKLLQNFLDSDRRISYIQDETGRLMFVNAALEMFIGKHTDQMLGSTIASLVDPDFAIKLEHLDEEVTTGQRRMEEDIAWNKCIYRISKFPLVLPDGNPGLGTFVMDITEQVGQEEDLKQNLKRSALLVDVLSSYEKPQDQLEVALVRVSELTKSPIGLLLRSDSSNGALHIQAWYGIENPAVKDLPLEVTRLFQTMLADNSALIQNHAPIKCPLFDFFDISCNELTSLCTVAYTVDHELAGIVLLANSPVGYKEQDSYQIKLLFGSVHTSMIKQQKEEELAASRQSLRLILDSTAEGIFGIDQQGLCTFCNASCLSLLGYECEQQLLGKNIHALIHHSTVDGTLINEHDCPIRKTLLTGIGVEMEDEVFWRKDGSCFDVLCYSYPQIKEDAVVGAVVTFTNNTERKANLAKIEYLSFHDQLTGLYNRAYFDETLVAIDHKRAYPISIIVGDVNGLKLTNDIFGHTAGDTLLTDVAKVLSSSCRSSDIISRIGGDEFVILLPNTGSNTAQEIVDRILHNLDSKGVLAGRRSIALGWATKTLKEERIHDLFDAAEDRMYRQKTLGRTETQRQQLEVLTNMLFTKAPKEREHALRVQQHAKRIGELLHASSEDVSLITRAGFYHDIGKVVLDTKLINAKGRDSAMQRQYQEHVISGFRILNTFEETIDLAPLVLHHHERWDGSGYLKGLHGEEIPYISRVLRLAEVWEREGLDEASMETKQAVLNKLAGTEVDPVMVSQILTSL